MPRYRDDSVEDDDVTGVICRQSDAGCLEPAQCQKECRYVHGDGPGYQIGEDGTCEPDEWPELTKMRLVNLRATDEG